MVFRRSTVAQEPYVRLNVGAYLGRIFKQGNIKLVPYTFVTEIKDSSVHLLFIPTKEARVEEGVDAVVLMTMFKSNNGLYPMVKGKVAEAYLIGDTVAPRTIHEAIMEGHRLGRKL